MIPQLKIRILIVDQNEVIATLTNFIESGGSPINKKKERVMNVIHQHIQSNNDNKNKREEPEWLFF